MIFYAPRWSLPRHRLALDTLATPYLRAHASRTLSRLRDDRCTFFVAVCVIVGFRCACGEGIMRLEFLLPRLIAKSGV